MNRQPDEQTGQYTLVNHRLLRNGYTTGSCAAGAAGAAVLMLMTGVPVEEMPLETPAGVLLHLMIEQPGIQTDSGGTPVRAVCAVRKDGGDDADATDGLLIFAEAVRTEESGISITGGDGIGVVTRPGLDQPVGNHAINSVPRQMITKSVSGICEQFHYSGGIRIRIFAPDGAAVAEKTFNSHMGIVGGISILGTTGIVLPMSRRALLDSIRVELNMLHASGLSYIIMSPGNYGAHFLRTKTDLNPDFSMKCSNFIGETLDMAEEVGIRGILFVAHIGKFIKLSGGIMNTHSRESDARMELLAAAALRAGAGAGTVREILDCVTTDEALMLLKTQAPACLDQTISYILDQIQYHLDRRTDGHLQTGVILFAGRQTLLGETASVPVLRKQLQQQENALT